jgi:hypothetical protein
MNSLQMLRAYTTSCAEQHSYHACALPASERAHSKRRSVRVHCMACRLERAQERSDRAATEAQVALTHARANNARLQAQLTRRGEAFEAAAAADARAAAAEAAAAALRAANARLQEGYDEFARQQNAALQVRSQLFGSIACTCLGFV